MEKNLTSPLQNILSQAKKLPATGVVAKLDRRIAAARRCISHLISPRNSIRTRPRHFRR